MNHSHCRVYVSVCSVHVKQVILLSLFWLLLVYNHWWPVKWNVFCLVDTKKFIISILGTICAPNAASLQSMALRVLFQKFKHSRHGQWEQGVIVSDGERGHRIRVRFH